MSVGHYENFPVASLLLPAPAAPAVEAIYRFARSADDFADEGDRSGARSAWRRLDALPRELARIAAGAAPHSPVLVRLAAVIADA